MHQFQAGKDGMAEPDINDGEARERGRERALVLMKCGGGLTAPPAVNDAHVIKVRE